VTYPGIEAIRAARRCGAWARSAGRPCKQPVVAGKNRCHWHGGRSGPPAGNLNGLRHGAWLPEVRAESVPSSAPPLPR
jgi:hypothetical protein